MYFFKPGGWEVQFLEADLETPPARKLTFIDGRSSEGWRREVKRGDSESQQMLENAIEKGRGGVT
jgi:hypothetical protein